MQLNLTADVADWLDKERGHRSRASFILYKLRELSSRDVSEQEEQKYERVDESREEMVKDCLNNK